MGNHGLSEKKLTESLNDMILLSRFYGYMILALAGFDNLKPEFPHKQKIKTSDDFWF